MPTQTFAGLEAQLAELAVAHPGWTVLLEGRGDRWWAQIDPAPGSGGPRYGVSAATPAEAVRRAVVSAVEGLAG